MFKFLKDKLKKAANIFSKGAEEELKEDKLKDKVEKKSEKSKKKEKEIKEKEEVSKENKAQKAQKKKEKSSHSQKVRKKKEVEETEEDQKEETEKTEKKSTEESKEKKGFFQKIFSKKEKEIKEESESINELEEEQEIKEPEQTEELQNKKGFFEKIGEAVTKKTLSESKFEELFWELEVGLLESNIALEVVEKIKEDLKEKLTNEKISRFDVEKIVISSLEKSIENILTFDRIDVLNSIKAKKEKPFVIAFVGVNGSGKTTTLAKIANYLKKNKFSVVMAAGDTFRAAAIHQLEIHADKIGVKIIKQDYGSDSAAVAFDAVKHAKATNKDVVLVDTAGRSHANVNLMDELKKVVRVAKPDLTLFVGDSLTGNDMVEQAKKFSEAVNVDGLILSKADVDEKGGATISASFVTKKPVVFIGTGQDYEDIEEFDKRKILSNLKLN